MQLGSPHATHYVLREEDEDEGYRRCCRGNGDEDGGDEEEATNTMVLLTERDKERAMLVDTFTFLLFRLRKCSGLIEKCCALSM